MNNESGGKKSRKKIKEMDQERAISTEKSFSTDQIPAEKISSDRSKIAAGIFLLLLINMALLVIGAAWLTVDIVWDFHFRQVILSLDFSMLLIIIGLALLGFFILIGTTYTGLKIGARGVVKVIARRVITIKNGKNTGAKYMTVASITFLALIMIGTLLLLLDIATLFTIGSTIARSIGYWLIVLCGVNVIMLLTLILMIFAGSSLYKYFEKTMSI
ncbi:MAG: hypothetical protein QXL15_03760 [Candidatus Korarchaeota archaeon]